MTTVLSKHNIEMKEELTQMVEQSNEKTKISVRDLNLFYGDKQALYSLSLDIKEKEVTALIGPLRVWKIYFLKNP
ncbi:Phosphate ABC transporter ATP-binding protein (PhoT family) OS=Ureibacillus acetophenoni OX=614649 GN=SAMN05877842_11584 PE=4 SV=1 [Ureibacillus acetophenoni]